MKLKNLFQALTALAGAWLLAAPAQAQDYPNKPVTIVVGYAAGGGVDFVARLLAEKLADRLKQPVPFFLFNNFFGDADGVGKRHEHNISSRQGNLAG